MKFLFYLLTLSLTVAGLASAQTESLSSKTFEFSLAGGQSYPSLPHEFKDYWKKGMNLEGGIGYSLQPGSFGYGALSLNLGYNSFSFDEGAFRNSLPAGKKTLTILGSPSTTFTALVTFRGTFSSTKKSIAPYFLMGTGYFYVLAKDISVPDDSTLTLSGESTSTISWMFGAGIDLPFADSWGVFVEGKYILGITGRLGRQYFPVSVGLRVKP